MKCWEKNNQCWDCSGNKFIGLIKQSSQKDEFDFSNFNKKENIKKFQEKNLKATYKGLVKHEHNLSEMDKNKLIIDANKLAKEHNKNKLALMAINGSIKKLKHELFAFVEKQLKK